MKFYAALLAMLAGGVFAAELITPAKTIQPVGVPTAKDARVMFSGLKPEAVQIGLGEAVLIGNVEHQKLPDNTTRSSVRWHTVGITSGSATQPLASPLSSQFRTEADTVPPGTQLNVKGDLDALAEDFLKLKAKLQKDTPKDTIKQVNNNKETMPGSSLTPTGGSNSGLTNSPMSSLGNNDSMKTDMVTTQWQTCQPRIDRATGKVYPQSRKLEVTESGRLMSQGECQDHGTPAAIVRTYGGDNCQPVVDIERRKVYEQFVEKATVDGKTIDVAACTIDYQKSTDLIATTNKCGYRHDFTGGKSIRQERLYYNKADGTVVDVRDCGDSTNAYAHYKTTATCTPAIDNINKQVFIHDRVAFKDGDGAEQYASDCQPDGSAAIPVKEEFCDPKYEHDFVNHVSYYRTRNYYTAADGSVVYVNECGRSATDSFPHIFNSGSCGVRNDDAKLMTYWKKLTQIQTPTDGIVEIAPCQETTSPTPYAVTGKAMGGTVVVANRVVFSADFSTPTVSQYNHKTPAQYLPNVDFNNPDNTVVHTAPWTGVSGTNYCVANGWGPVQWGSYDGGAQDRLITPHTRLALYSYKDSSDGPGGSWRKTFIASDFSSANGIPIDRITKRPVLQQYLRGDGSTYSVEVGGQYAFDAGCFGRNGAYYW